MTRLLPAPHLLPTAPGEHTQSICSLLPRYSNTGEGSSWLDAKCEPFATPDGEQIQPPDPSPAAHEETNPRTT